jgi:hypothetical protein
MVWPAKCLQMALRAALVAGRTNKNGSAAAPRTFNRGEHGEISWNRWWAAARADRMPEKATQATVEKGRRAWEDIVAGIDDAFSVDLQPSRTR